MQVTRYHGALVALHWLLALMLLGMLGYGSLGLSHIPNSSPEKVDALRGHMIGGGLILALMLLRLVLRVRTAHPPPAATGKPTLDRLAPVVHWALYGLVFLMAGSGIATSVLAGLPAIVFGGVGNLPANFDALPPRFVHGVVANLLMLGIAGHVAAALYHQLVSRDSLFARMGFGRR